ncbi:hypothetical protein FJZ36_10255 [Candidatus Poribacteria bacterium]|nr:hypothetical protein [Candidatus Poribacteria bacterium]
MNNLQDEFVELVERVADRLALESGKRPSVAAVRAAVRAKKARVEAAMRDYHPPRWTAQCGTSREAAPTMRYLRACDDALNPRPMFFANRREPPAYAANAADRREAIRRMNLLTAAVAALLRDKATPDALRPAVAECARRARTEGFFTELTAPLPTDVAERLTFIASRLERLVRERERAKTIGSRVADAVTDLNAAVANAALEGRVVYLRAPAGWLTLPVTVHEFAIAPVGTFPIGAPPRTASELQSWRDKGIEDGYIGDMMLSLPDAATVAGVSVPAMRQRIRRSKKDHPFVSLPKGTDKRCEHHVAFGDLLLWLDTWTGRKARRGVSQGGELRVVVERSEIETRV